MIPWGFPYYRQISLSLSSWNSFHIWRQILAIGVRCQFFWSVFQVEFTISSDFVFVLLRGGRECISQIGQIWLARELSLVFELVQPATAQAPTGYGVVTVCLMPPTSRSLLFGFRHLWSYVAPLRRYNCNLRTRYISTTCFVSPRTLYSIFGVGP